ncbi:SbcC/MukB-like Walker B domain-containing protein, partial [Microbispora sp. NPDC049633]|uniref:SbcC/MukB-like Walker B domain-containing protein n=1 Tax=Microbispora sp. NPDC049633 TaxID=3154355 RepID=UPI00341E08D8
DERRLAEVIDAARGEDASLAARLDRLEEEADLLREAAEAAVAAAAADRESRAALAEADRAAAEEGFASLEHAAAAVRAPEDREAMSERLGHLDAERATIEGLLADPELVTAAAQPAADLPELEAGHERAERDHAVRTSARDRARGRLDQLTGLAGELGAALRAYRPAEERHRLARRLAELATGTSGDNRWHMRLSAYVLGERLRQVVDAANERLDRMSSGRYLLRHDLSRSAGDRGRSGGGLGLRVLDAWTGVERDPATLSGGESFITSLALALGLADVVTAEAGGAEIGSLFVDEGFGTLDDETLDDVLDILDGLREGGRAVGVVSHVAELRVRIPAQLRVVKGRSGSTLSHR